jgi:phage tail sheath gpL-like
MPFDFIVSPYTDATSMAALTALLNDANGRWSWQTQVYGHIFMAYRGTYGNLTSFGVMLNDQHTSVMGFYDSPSWVAMWAAALAGAAAASIRVDPAVPLQTVPIAGVRAPPIPSRFSRGQRNALLFDGVSTFGVSAAGVVSIENLITTYQLNAFGQPDNSYLEIETMFTLMAVLRALAVSVTSKFARFKLAADGTPILPGRNIATPSMIKGYLVAQYQQLQDQGLVQGSDFFAANVVVQQNATNPNRVDVLWPGVLIDQLRIFALLAQFRLITPPSGAAGTASAAIV